VAGNGEEEASWMSYIGESARDPMRLVYLYFMEENTRTSDELY
jgi:hypothetical protein